MVSLKKKIINFKLDFFRSVVVGKPSAKVMNVLLTEHKHHIT